ncbi:unnamed protein product [Staurois parvus]|uniref:Uncharacterized protein n=1 Tax=Staurois parvus TaxID=386267 RepID=A0ABN9C836_9NEOB|nr:unnamed protein product [Staurois parvus]
MIWQKKILNWWMPFVRTPEDTPVSLLMRFRNCYPSIRKKRLCIKTL